MAMYKVTARQVFELTDYIEADSKMEAEYVARQRVSKGVYDLGSTDAQGEVVITAKEIDDIPPSEMNKMNVFNDLPVESFATWDKDNIKDYLSDLR